ncbi:helix-turn-helix domain-containing protein [Devosia nitrariae]|uniref:helix-turn-helix domain-containing protein n=1 Tax=Devosia nitrariae TaxID=2071872 RepID=UPI0024E0650F|nr:AraC family transcriptional regulator [Devosia nitrariae]
MLKDLIAYGHRVRVFSLPRAPVPLHAMAISAGYEQRVNEVYSWDGLQRGDAPFLVVQHTLAGRGRLDFAGTAHVLTPGKTMLLSLPHAHRYWLERGQSWEYFWMVLNGREALRLAREAIDVAGPVLTPSGAVVDRLAAACLTLIKRPDIEPGEVSTAAYAALAALYDATFSGPRVPRAELPAPIGRAMAYIEENLARSINVERIAGVAQMSRAHFVRQFTAVAGTAPSTFLFERRIERVERLLLATDMSVTAIAAATGFANANYLAKAFRRVHGLAPLEYRIEARNAVGA